jgi:hypothetical protein
MINEYLSDVRKLFSYYKSVGEKTFEQLEDEDLFWRYNEHSNSIGIIVNHLWGNMKSRWTDFLTSDGEKNGAIATLNSNRLLIPGKNY